MRVLVVDDEADIRLVVATALDGIDVVEAGDAPTALALLRVEHVDAVVLDAMLPGTDGFELLVAIREELGLVELPILMLTAKASESDHVTAFRHGADAYLTKPFDVDELVAAVVEIVRRPPAARSAARAEQLGRAELLASLESRFGV